MQDHERHFLAGVIGAAPGRVVAVIGGDDDEVVLVDPREEAGEPRVELDQRLRVAGDVAAVAVEHVEIDEVREDQPVVGRVPQLVDRGHAFGVRGRGRRARDAAAGEDVADLAHAFDREPGFLDRVEHGARRHHRIIVPAARALPRAGLRRRKAARSRGRCDTASQCRRAMRQIS